MGLVPRLPDNLNEIGNTGLRRGNGFVHEEFLPQLSNWRAGQVYREMRDNDPVIGGLLFAVDMMIRQVDWWVQPASPDKSDVDAAEFVEQCREDMSISWEDFISEALSMLPFGYAPFEIVYKKRSGTDGRDGRTRSRFNDGKIGWRKFGIRAQETIEKWDFTPTGMVKGFWQKPPPDYKSVYIPIERALLFRTTLHKNNPEGRALALDTPIPTPDGWRTMAELNVGDLVFDDRGYPTRVAAVADWDDRPVYRVTFADGTSVVADENHEWVASTAQQRSKAQGTRVVTTADMAASFDCTVGNRYNGLALPGELVLPERDLLVDPWLLGYWLGNGNSRSASFACHVDDLDEIVSLVEATAPAGSTVKHRQVAADNGATFGVTTGKGTRDNLQSRLAMLGVLGDKHVPDAYLWASARQRRALLQGLLDSDGSITRGQVEFISKRLSLAEAVVHLARSLGEIPTLTRKPTEWGGVWRVQFTPATQVFRLARKADRVQGGSRRHLFIRSVKRLDVCVPTRCIEVESPTHQFLVGERMAPTHNSVLRNAYRPWYFKRRLEEIEAIGIERDLAGFPMIYVDPDILDENASASKKAILTEYKDAVVNIRRDAQEGLIMPSIFDEHGNQLYKLELVSSGGNRQFDTNSIIQRYDQRIATTVLADFILLGQSTHGSFAMSSDKTGMFALALKAWLDIIASVLNEHAIPRLLRLNGMNTEKLPQLRFSDIETPDLGSLGNFIQVMANAGAALFPDPKLENHLREIASLPRRDEDPSFDSDGPQPNIGALGMAQGAQGANNAEKPPKTQGAAAAARRTTPQPTKA